MLYIENTNSNITKVQRREIWTSPTTGEDYVIERMMARGTFTETMELDYFPFDCQVRISNRRTGLLCILARDF